jgi:hypothetical protein
MAVIVTFAELARVGGAVYSPLLEMVPALAVHVTAVSVVPVTRAVNCCVVPARTDAVPGVTATFMLLVWLSEVEEKEPPPPQASEPAAEARPRIKIRR